jgi:hypothetical protein
MPACPPVVFTNVDAKAWAELKAKVATFARDRDVEMPFEIADAGEKSMLGFTASWEYDAQARTLTITCTKRPFFLSCSKINSEIIKRLTDTGCVLAANLKSS